MTNCGKLTRGARYDCDNPAQGGVEKDVILVNKDDILGVTRTSIEGVEFITDLVLKNNAIGYEFQGFGTSVVPSHTLRRSATSVTYDHIVQLQVFEVNQWQKNNLEKAALGRQVAIVKNFSNDLDRNYFEIYGLDIGLQLNELTREPSNSETGGSFTGIFRTLEDRPGEKKMPVTWFDTDLATTEAKIRAKLNLPIVDNIAPVAGAVAGGTAFDIQGQNFFNLDGLSQVTRVDWIDESDLATQQTTGVTVPNDGRINIAASVALTAGTYKVRVTTNNGVAESARVVVIS